MKSKPCKAPDCDRPVWSKGYCMAHQYLRDNSKDIRSRQTFRRGNNLRRVSKRKMEDWARRQEDRADLRRKDVEFYSEIWSERPHYCAVTGRYLGREPLTTYFDHILEKEKWPQFRHCKWNIILLHPDVHADKARYPELVDLRNKLLELHVKEKPPE